MASSSDWFFYSGRMHKRVTEEALFQSAIFTRTVLVVDAAQEDYYKGLCFIYGKMPRGFHVIHDGRAIVFEPTKQQLCFAYQYHPADLQLDYTPYAPQSVDVSPVAADAKP